MEEIYKNDYKHFDLLIWQLPGWSTGVFVLTVTGLSVILNLDREILEPYLSNKECAIGFLAVCVFFQIAIFNALVRFRAHQFDTIDKEELKMAKWFYSGQFWLQNAVIFQTGTLFYVLFILLSFKEPRNVAIFTMVVMLAYSIGTILYKKSKL